MSFFLTPLVLTALAYLFIIFVRYQRERDIINMLPYLLQPNTLLTLLAIFLVTSFLKIVLSFLG